jgi:hypothetical protein
MRQQQGFSWWCAEILARSLAMRFAFGSVTSYLKALIVQQVCSRNAFVLLGVSCHRRLFLCKHCVGLHCAPASLAADLLFCALCSSEVGLWLKGE